MITNTKEQPGAFDIMAEQKAAPDEPKFTLWARDPHAAPLVLEWARRNRERAFGRDDLTPEKLRAELLQSTDAEEIAWAMLDYRKGQATDEKREAPRPAPSYSGHNLTADELAAKERFDKLIIADARLSNAIGEATDQAEVIRRLGYGAEADRLLAAVDEFKAVAEVIRPKRRGWAVEREDSL